MERGRRQDRGQAAGRHPAPPVTDAGQVREHRAVRPERLCARRRDPADAVRPHQHQLGPAGQRQPSSAAGRRPAAGWPRCPGLSDECAEQEQALVAAAHRQRRGADPSHDRGMSTIAHGRSFSRLRRHCMEHQAPRRSPHYILRPVSVLPQVVVFFLAAALRGAAFLADAFFVARPSSRRPATFDDCLAANGQQLVGPLAEASLRGGRLSTATHWSRRRSRRRRTCRPWRRPACRSPGRCRTRAADPCGHVGRAAAAENLRLGEDLQRLVQGDRQQLLFVGDVAEVLALLHVRPVAAVVGE